MHPAIPLWPAVHESASDHLVLRDGTVATVRQATAADRSALRRFFHELSPESRHKRFFGSGEPPDHVIDRFCETSNPAGRMTLIALRQLGGLIRPIAVASYVAVDQESAEVAFAVGDDFHGKGLGTALLERLASIASQHGFRRFEASTLADNQAMLEVFRDSGFEVRSKSAQGLVDVRLDLTLSPNGIAAIDERNRVATVASLRPILQPRAVAVVGASRERSNLGRRVFDAIVRAGFGGPVYPVNPHTVQISGRRGYRSMRDVPAGVDLAVVAVPRDAVLGVVDDCAAAGVRSLVVISAGFAERGLDGEKLQSELVEKARSYGMRLIGPNCMGVLNTNPVVSLNASFSEQVPPHGCIALSSQSGGLGLALLQLAAQRLIGVSTFVSLGNKADVSGNDLLQYGESDPDTSVILLYLESFGNPRRFAQLARRIGRKKPIVAVKAGRTRAGSRAAGSHTAGLATSDAAVAALFRQSGIIRADTIDEMFDVAACLDLQPLPAGRRVGIITNAGGPGILAADACEAADLTVTEFSTVLRERLAERLSAYATLGNPVDLVASAGPVEYRHAIEVTLASDEIDALIIIYTPIDDSQSAEIVAGIGQGIVAARLAGATNKPVLACTMTSSGRGSPLGTGEESVPTYVFPENAARALGKAAAYAAWRAEPPGMCWGFDAIHAEEARALCRDVVAARGDTWLTPEELNRVLNAFGLPLSAGAIAVSEDEAAALAALMGFPAVLKVSSADVLHKTDIGGVRLNLTSEPAVRAAYHDIAERLPASTHADPMNGVLIQPMFTGVETLIGLSADPVFGPLVGFSLGGVDAEVLRDVAFRMAPLTDRDADELLHDIRSFPLLQGHRGRPPADVDALRELLLRVSLIGQHIPEILELDLNPVIALPEGHGCRVVDARARVGPPHA